MNNSNNLADIIPSKQKNIYSLMHSADIGDRSVCFTFDELTIEQVKDLTAYIQLKAEFTLDEHVSLENSTIVTFLVLIGAKRLDTNHPNTQENMFIIDAHEEHENHICGSNWIKEHYHSLDAKYGDTAFTLLIKASSGKDWHSDCI